MFCEIVCHFTCYFTGGNRGSKGDAMIAIRQVLTSDEEERGFQRDFLEFVICQVCSFYVSCKTKINLPTFV